MSYHQRNEMIGRLGFSDYSEYLKSPLWMGIRAKVILASKKKCCACPKKATQVHHGAYTWENLSGIDRNHLHAICRTCHEAIEFDDGGTKIMDMRLIDRRLSALISGAAFGDLRKATVAKKKAKKAPPRKPRPAVERKTPREWRALRKTQRKAAQKASKKVRQAHKEAWNERLRTEWLAYIEASGQVPKPHPILDPREKPMRTPNGENISTAELARRVTDAEFHYEEALAGRARHLAKKLKTLERARAALAERQGAQLAEAA